MITTWLLLCVAPLIGIVVGLMPGLGALLVVLLLYPLLILMPSWAVVVFYAMVIAARDFSGSVAALGFGMLGEVSSGPALRERNTIVAHQGTAQAIMDTMWASQMGVIISTVLLITAVWLGTNTAWLFRSDVQATFLAATLVFLLMWANQAWWKNAGLMVLGYVIGAVGYNIRNQTDFMTWGNSYLAGGLPVLPVILGIYAVPVMLRIAATVPPPKAVSLTPTWYWPNTWSSMIRGSVIGALCGLVPYVGCVITSNLAHWLERFWYKAQSLSHSLRRLSAAEAANNAAHVTSLIPFIVMGLAVQPSELLLLDILHNQGARPQDIAGLLILVTAGIAVSAVISGWLCGSVVTRLMTVFGHCFAGIVAVMILALLANIAWLGWSGDQTVYYLVTFAVSMLVGLWLYRHVDALPLVLVLLLQNQLDIVLPRLYQFYLA